MVASGVSAFAELLYRLIEHHGSLREFAARVGQSHSLFSQIRSGMRPAPLEHVPAWADALGLKEGSFDRQRFLDLAALTPLPPDARKRFERLLEENDDYKVKLAAFRRLLDESRGGRRAGKR